MAKEMMQESFGDEKIDIYYSDGEKSPSHCVVTTASELVFRKIFEENCAFTLPNWRNSSHLMQSSEGLSFKRLFDVLELFYSKWLNKIPSEEDKFVFVVKKKTSEQRIKKYISKLKEVFCSSFREKVFNKSKAKRASSNSIIDGYCTRYSVDPEVGNLLKRFFCINKTSTKKESKDESASLENVLKELLLEEKICYELFCSQMTQRVTKSMLDDIKDHVKINIIDKLPSESQTLEKFEHHLNSRKCKKPLTSLDAFYSVQTFFHRLKRVCTKYKIRASKEVIDCFNTSLRLVNEMKGKLDLNHIIAEVESVKIFRLKQPTVLRCKSIEQLLTNNQDDLKLIDN